MDETEPHIIDLTENPTSHSNASGRNIVDPDGHLSPSESLYETKLSLRKSRSPVFISDKNRVTQGREETATQINVSENISKRDQPTIPSLTNSKREKLTEKVKSVKNHLNRSKSPEKARRREKAPGKQERKSQEDRLRTTQLSPNSRRSFKPIEDMEGLADLPSLYTSRKISNAQNSSDPDGENMNEKMAREMREAKEAKRLLKAERRRRRKEKEREKEIEEKIDRVKANEKENAKELFNDEKIEDTKIFGNKDEIERAKEAKLRKKKDFRKKKIYDKYQARTKSPEPDSFLTAKNGEYMTQNQTISAGDDWAYPAMENLYNSYSNPLLKTPKFASSPKGNSDSVVSASQDWDTMSGNGGRKFASSPKGNSASVVSASRDWDTISRNGGYDWVENKESEKDVGPVDGDTSFHEKALDSKIFSVEKTPQNYGKTSGRDHGRSYDKPDRDKLEQEDDDGYRKSRTHSSGDSRGFISTQSRESITKFQSSIFNGHLMKWRFEAEEGNSFVRIPLFFAAVSLVCTTTFALIYYNTVWTIPDIVMSVFIFAISLLAVILEGRFLCVNPVGVRAHLRSTLTHVFFLRLLWGRGILYMIGGILSCLLLEPPNVFSGVFTILISSLAIYVGNYSSRKFHALRSSLRDPTYLMYQFEVHDYDSDGYITLSGFVTLLASLGMELDDRYIVKAFNSADTDGDFKISYEDFSIWWKNGYRSRDGDRKGNSNYSDIESYMVEDGESFTEYDEQSYHRMD